jgi:uncharacterized membrane protein
LFPIELQAGNVSACSCSRKMQDMHIVIYVIAGLYILLALALFFAYYRTRHPGTFMMGIAYASTAGSALVLMHWGPLLIGFVIVWVLRLMGLDPSTDIGRDRQ